VLDEEAGPERQVGHGQDRELARAGERQAEGLAQGLGELGLAEQAEADQDAVPGAIGASRDAVGAVEGLGRSEATRAKEGFERGGFLGNQLVINKALLRVVLISINMRLPWQLILHRRHLQILHHKHYFISSGSRSL
jgi:hypothetical protein